MACRFDFEAQMIARSLDEALAPITDGCVLAVPREVSGVAMAATRALIRRGVKRLHLIALPTSSLQADLLIGAGCVETIETSAVSLGEFGPAPRFTAAVTAGAVRVKDATCPALHAAFQAAEKGVPFMPLRGLIGSDVLAYRKDWKLVDNRSATTIRSCCCRRSSPMSRCSMRRSPTAKAISGSAAIASSPPWRMPRRRQW
jgi:acyl CoA:acetate/3-ketoacid CoA transferase alpha subunit